MPPGTFSRRGIAVLQKESPPLGRGGCQVFLGKGNDVEGLVRHGDAKVEQFEYAEHFGKVGIEMDLLPRGLQGWAVQGAGIAPAPLNSGYLIRLIAQVLVRCARKSCAGLP